MIDLKKPRYLVKDRLAGRVDKYGHEEKPCDYCYMKNGCAMNPSDCWELDIYLKLKSFELAIESGELVPVVRGKWEVDECDSFDDVPGYSWIEFHCSKCNMDYGLEEGEYSWCRGEKIPYHFCPNCGARMDLQEEK